MDGKLEREYVERQENEDNGKKIRVNGRKECSSG